MKTFILFFAMSVLAIFPCQADSVIEISGLDELAKYAAGDNNSVKLRPGTYRMIDFLGADSIAAYLDRGQHPYMIFSGNGNTFDFEGVTIELDTRLRKMLRHPIHTNELMVTGNGNTMKGLTIRNIGNETSPGGAVFCVEGTGNTIDGFTLYVRGAFPYGYGDLFGKGGPDVIRHQKHSGFLVTGSDTKVLNTTLVMRSFGHGFYIQKSADNILFENCYVEGELFSTDDVLKETSGPAFDVDFRTWTANREGKYIVTPGYTKSMCEEGFRTYNRDNDNIVFINCTAKNTRGGFELRTNGGVRLENCTTIGTERAYWVGNDAVIENCKGDANYGPLLFLEGSNASVDLVVSPAESDRLVHSLVTIQGTNNKVVLRPENGVNRTRELPILIGYTHPEHGEAMSPYSEAPCVGLELTNETTMPVVVGEMAVNCVVKERRGDLGDGTYRNPVLMADYSDPDVVRVGEDYYMTSSSFNCTPGLPILHSKDLVNWDLVGHALPRLTPLQHYSIPQHGKGVWAPCIRHHNGEFYIYWGDPDFGIFMVKAKDPRGGWSEPVLVKEGKGLIDPSPLWDDDGRAWMVHAWAGSRAGFNSVLTVFEMNAEGTASIGGETMVFDGNDSENHTVEGPKFYKRDGWYWIFAPAGGVATGWQLAMRSKNILGPYEARIVMAQGTSDINGPHQGAWVETSSGEGWFLNFQELPAYGRVVHLNPLYWREDGWCVIGEDPDGDGVGEPVRRHRKPATGKAQPFATPAESDEFDNPSLGVQWQWHANPQDWFGLGSGYGSLRMYAFNEHFDNMWSVPNLLLQKFPAEEFTATAKLKFCSKSEGDGGGLIVMGDDYARAAVTRSGKEAVIEFITCRNADTGASEQRAEITRIPLQKAESGAVPLYHTDIWFRVEVGKGAECAFSYSTDGKQFRPMGVFGAKEGRWIGAKVGLHMVGAEGHGERGWLDADRFTITESR